MVVPGLGEDLLEVLAQGLRRRPFLVEIARPKLGQVPARVLPALPFGPGLVAGLDRLLGGLVEAERGRPLLLQPAPEPDEEDEKDDQGDERGQTEPAERPPLPVVEQVKERVHRSDAISAMSRPSSLRGLAADLDVLEAAGGQGVDEGEEVVEAARGHPHLQADRAVRREARVSAVM